jgi:membrane-bound lytic murein transglycosylase MltF
MGEDMSRLHKREINVITCPASVLIFSLLTLLVVACSEPSDHGSRKTGVQSSSKSASLDASDATALAEVWPTLAEPWVGDLDGMLERGEIRLLTTFTLGTYFIDQGRPRGMVVESADAFTKFVKRKLGTRAKNVKLIIIPVRRDQLLPFLIDGYGDIASATLRITPRRLDQVDFSVPFTEQDREYLIMGPASPEVKNLEDLAGKEVVIREDSSYFDTLTALNERFRAQGQPDIVITAADPRLETEDLMEMVHAGLLPMTVADDFRTRLWTKVFDNLRTREDLVLHKGGEIALAIRKHSPQLKALLDDFVRSYQVGMKIPNTIIQRYRDKAGWTQGALERNPFHRLQETEGLFMKYGEQYGFDWLLLASFAYQESGLDQSARSAAGAVGIMQILPRTARAKNVGITDIDNLENNIHAGTKYLSVLRNTYFADAGLDPFQQTLFAIAGYNAGPNRINRMRKQAAERGLDPDLWFHNVELVVAARVGAEPVQYVRNIYQYYIAYKRVLAESEERERARKPVFE